MPNSKVFSPLIIDLYSGLHELGGAVLDEDSYQKHRASAPVSSSTEDPSALQADLPAADPFDAPQDLGHVAAQALHVDQLTEYRPETASFYSCTLHENEPEQTLESSAHCETTQEVYCPGEMKIIIGEPSCAEIILRQGSDLTSWHSSGTIYMVGSSYHMSSGSFRISSYSFQRFSHARSSRSSGSFYSQMALQSAKEDQPYLGSLNWDSDERGYGLQLI